MVSEAIQYVSRTSFLSLNSNNTVAHDKRRDQLVNNFYPFRDSLNY